LIVVSSQQIEQLKIIFWTLSYLPRTSIILKLGAQVGDTATGSQPKPNSGWEILPSTWSILARETSLGGNCGTAFHG
jgi:hypothetical protein